MIELGIAALAMIAFFVAITVHGPVSYVTMGVTAFFAYNLPALLDTQNPFNRAVLGGPLIRTPTPPEADLAVLFAWVGLVLVLVVTGVRRTETYRAPVPAPAPLIDDPRLGRIMRIATAAAIVGTLYLMLRSGPLFFLEDRDLQLNDFVTLLWRWFVLFGLLSSILMRDRRMLMINVFVLLLIYVRGDRTMLAISGGAMLMALTQVRGRWQDVLSPSVIFGLVGALLLIVFGKPLYTDLKQFAETGIWDPVGYYYQRAILQLEPFTTFSHIGYVINNRIEIGFPPFVESLLGHLLIFPSVFGVSTNIYNETVTRALLESINFGVAGNLLAHGYTVAGNAGVAVFAGIFVALCRIADVGRRSKGTMVPLFFLAAGSIVAVYAHRNGLDNLFSFIRQVLVVALSIAATLWVWEKLEARSTARRVDLRGGARR